MSNTYTVTTKQRTPRPRSKRLREYGMGGSAVVVSSLSGDTSVASKLATPRTLWGQLFDGTANVYGDMSSVGRIDMTGPLTINRRDDDGADPRLLLTVGEGSLGGFMGYDSAAAMLYVGVHPGDDSEASGDINAIGISATGLTTLLGGAEIPSNKTLKIGDAVISWDASAGALKVSHPLYSDSWISAFGVGSSSSSGSGGTSYDRLDAWGAYTSAKEGWVLSAKLGYDLYSRVNTLEAQGGGEIYPLTMQSGIFSAATYNPRNSALTVNIPTTTDHVAEGSNLYYTDARVASKVSKSYVDGLGVNADTLDGYHAARISREFTASLTFDHLYDRADHWYRVGQFLLGNGQSPHALIWISRNYNTTTNEGYLFAVTVGYQGSVSVSQLAGEKGGFLIQKVRVVYNRSYPFTTWFDIQITAKATNAVRIAAVGQFTVADSVAIDPTIEDGQDYVEHITVNGMSCNYGFTGNVTGNASSATKLQTARTLWGQSFDGTANVDGLLTTTGGVTIRKTINTDNDVMLRLTESADYRGGFVNYNGASDVLTIGVHNANDSAQSSDIAAISIVRGTANVSIAKALGVMGLTTLSGGAQIPAAKTLKIGDAVISWDASAEALKVSHPLYSDSWISAFGVNSGSGSGSSGEITVEGIRLDNWGAYTAAKESYVLSAKLGYNLHSRLSALETETATHTHSFADITSKPSDLAGYGITDGVNDVSVEGGGNAVTSASISGHVLTLTKGATFLDSGNYSDYITKSYIEGLGITASSVPWSAVTSTPTTLAGYGITDALAASSYTAADVLAKIKTVDGAGSGLDADTLDGYHAARIAREFTASLTFDHLYDRADHWYRVGQFNLGHSQSPHALIWISRNYSYNLNEGYLFAVTVGYQGSVSVSQLAGEKGGFLIQKVRVVYNRSYPFTTWFDIQITAKATNAVRIAAVGQFTVADSVAIDPTIEDGQAYVEHITVNGMSCNYGFTGDVTGNASSATKLQTARTLWGQSFDGTGNVSGSLTGVTTITASGIVKAPQLAVDGTYATNSAGIILTNAATDPAVFGISVLGADKLSDYTLMRINSPDVPARYVCNTNVTTFASNGGSGWLFFDAASNESVLEIVHGVNGQNSTGTAIVNAVHANANLYTKGIISSAGNITTTGSAYIASASSVRASTYVSAGSYVQATTYLQAGTYAKIGDATLTWDSTNQCLTVDKPIVSTSYISAFGVGSSGGSGSGSDYERLDSWGAYTADKEDWVLSAKLGYGLYQSANTAISRIGVNENAINLLTARIMEVEGGQFDTLNIVNNAYFNGYVTANQDVDIDANLNVTGGAVTIGSGSVSIPNSLTQYTTNAILKVVQTIYTSNNFVSQYGGIAGSMGWRTASDARLKDVQGDISLTTAQVAAAPAVDFRWKENGGEDCGTLAQYWQSVLPHSVTLPDTDDGYMAMAYGKAALLSAIVTARTVVDHESRIANTEQRIAVLEAENAQLRQRIATLESIN